MLDVQGWSKHFSNTWKKHYYFNARTGKQSWEFPDASASASPAQNRGASAQPAKQEQSSQAAGAGVKRKLEETKEDEAAKRRRAREEWGMGPGMDDEPDEPDEADRAEDTPELAVLRDKEMKKLLALLRTLCARSQVRRMPRAPAPRDCCCTARAPTPPRPRAPAPPRRGELIRGAPPLRTPRRRASPKSRATR